jgi:hypothetical protein
MRKMLIGPPVCLDEEVIRTCVPGVSAGANELVQRLT